MSSRLTARLTANVILMKDDKVLIVHEPDDQGGMRFNLPGGHVEMGETVLDAAKREVGEETGLDVTLTKLVLMMTRLREEGTHTVRHVFVGEILGGVLQAEEGSELKWMTKQDVLSLEGHGLIFGVAEAVSRAFEKKYLPLDQVLFSQAEGYETLPY